MDFKDVAKVFPYNLAESILLEEGIPFYRVSPPDLEKALYLLSARERDVIGAIYSEGKTLEEIAKTHDVTRERIRQTHEKAILRLRELKKMYLLVPASEKQVEPYLGNISVNSLGVPVRVQNCLKRAGAKTLRDLAEKDIAWFLKVRNLGKKGVEDVLKEIAKYGIHPIGAENYFPDL